jgi:hypothetical protein
MCRLWLDRTPRRWKACDLPEVRGMGGVSGMTVILDNEVTPHTGRRKLGDIMAEYEAKSAALADSLAAFEAAQVALKSSVCVQGVWPHDRLNSGHVTLREMEKLLLKSAWRFAYQEFGLDRLASAKDKSRIDRMLEDPPAFTPENLFQWFGDIAADPRGAILRGLAEVFGDLDPAFKSHEKMKIGVKGLPKRVILSNIEGFGSYGRDKLISILNAIASITQAPMVDYAEVSEILKTGQSARGVSLKKYANGNGHLYFEPGTLKAVNLALAEYYGDVLPDCPEERPAKPSASTEVSKDLQFYPTPAAVVSLVMAEVTQLRGLRVLEPSCGDGRFMAAIRRAGGTPYGIEVDPVRARETSAAGFPCLCANFLRVSPSQDFDAVIMNPPFYGKHYAKHVRHALRFLKPGGILYAILPVTARYDHGLLDDLSPRWQNLPVGSFKESGTNINTCLMTVRTKS